MTPPSHTQRNRLFVLGAGFSHSYNPDFSPLATGFLHNALKRHIFRPKGIHKELAGFINQYFGNDYRTVNIEVLATFLATHFVPRFEDQPEYKSKLYDQLIGIIVRTLGDEKVLALPPKPEHKTVLKKFVRYLVKRKISILTFNYDLILDNYLNRTAKWFMTDGYGLPMPFMGGEEYTAVERNKFKSSIQYFKLHGSLNWGVPMVQFPYDEDGKVFVGPWFPKTTEDLIPIEGALMSISDYDDMEYSTFIIPPIYSKSLDNPLVKYLWYVARERIACSDEVVFLGYSFSPSDIMAEFLLRQAMARPPTRRRKITIVNRSVRDDYKKRVSQIFFGSDLEFISSDIIKYLKETILGTK